jgi:amidase
LAERAQAEADEYRRQPARGGPGTVNEILALSGTAQARLIREGAVSSVELITAHLERIAEVNPALNAAIDILEESALAAARASDARSEKRPLEGVPFSVKDSIEVEGTVCSAGTLGFRNAPPSKRDAVLVARLRDAGAIPIARTNLPDLLFAFETDNLIFGRTNNPHDLTRTSGGSSGGEAALIAACGSPFGLGSDCAGSVRVPAHYCGIAALKPTSGRLDRTGHVPPASGWLEMLWQIGPMSRHAEDLSTLLPLLLDPADHRGEGGPPASRVAYFTDNGIATPDPATRATVIAAAKTLSSLGYVVSEHTPSFISCAYDLEMQFIGPDAGDSLRDYLQSIGSTPHHSLLEAWLQKLGPYRTTLAGFADCWTALNQFRSEMFRTFEDYDAILSPVSSSPAVPHGASTKENVFRGYSYTMTYNLTGWPACVIPFGKSPEGLPIGIQIAAPPWREDVALGLAVALTEVVNVMENAGLASINTVLASR